MAAPISRSYLPRLLEGRIETLFEELPALLIVGARAVGKTTLARRHAASVVRLDREDDATPFRIDADAALRGLPEPVLLDEWQMVPGVLGAVKRAIDDDPRPGRFVVTGSVRADLESATWPGTGRVVRLTLHGLSVRERVNRGTGTSIFDAIVEHGPDALGDPVADPPDARRYLELAIESGFPEALGLTPRARDAWMTSYVEQLLTRDAELVDRRRDPDRLRRFVTAYAAHTAQVIDDLTLIEAAGIDRRTARAYEQLLNNLFVAEPLPAWSANHLKQLVRRPKRHIVDTGLAAEMLGLDADGLFRNARLLGPVLESFVVSQLRAEIASSWVSPRFFHLRTRGGRHEIDLVVEFGGGQLVAIEVKASRAPTERDARHLMWLRDEVPHAFLAGFVFHMGPRTYALDDRILAVPIAALWSRP